MPIPKKLPITRRLLVLGSLLSPSTGYGAPMLNTRVQSVEDVFTGVGRGDAILDTAAFRALAAMGRPFYARGDYQIARRVCLTRGAQIIGRGSRKSRLVARTGLGQFDRDRSSGGIGREDNTMFKAHLADGIAFENLLFEMEWNDDIRTVRPIVLDQCAGARIEACDITGFKDPHGGLVTLDRSDSFVVRNLRGYDIFTDSADQSRLPAQQISLIEFDNNSGKTPSQSFLIDGVRGWNIDQGPASRSTYGYQTDLVNGQGRGDTGGRIRNLHAKGLAEVLDFWGNRAIIDGVEAEDTIGSVLKFAYGASNNVVRNVTSDGCGLSQIVVANSNNPVASESPTGNRFERISLMNSGKGWSRYWGTTGAPEVSPQAAISLETASGFLGRGPTNNHFSGLVHAQDASSCPVLLCANRTGPGNTFVGDLLVPPGGRAAIVLHDNNPPGLTVRLSRPSLLSLTSNQGSKATSLVAMEDPRGQWDYDAQTFTPFVPGKYRIYGTLYASSSVAWPNGVRLLIWKSDAFVAAQSPGRNRGGREFLEIDISVQLESNTNPTDSGSPSEALRFEYALFPPSALDHRYSRLAIERARD